MDIGRNQKWLHRVVAVVAILILGTWQSPVALAGHWWGFNAGNWEVWFTQCNLDPTVHHFFHENDDHDVDDSPDGPPVTDIDSRKTGSHSDCTDIDIRIQDGHYGATGWRGYYQCLATVADPDGPAGAISCDHGLVYINLSDDEIPEVDPVTEQTICHEVGHALGLDHSWETGGHPADGRAGTCMEDPITGARSHFLFHDMHTIDYRHNPSPLD